MPVRRFYQFTKWRHKPHGLYIRLFERRVTARSISKIKCISCSLVRRLLTCVRQESQESFMFILTKIT